MDEVNTAADRERRIRGLMERLGVDEGRANFIVDLADGKTRGDVVGLSDDERRALGLDRSALDDLDDERASPVPAAATSSTEGDRAGES